MPTIYDTRPGQVSWLGAWALLLGFRDYQHEVQIRLGLPCLRPAEEEMLQVAQLWARICAAAEVRVPDAAAHPTSMQLRRLGAVCVWRAADWAECRPVCV